MPTVTNKQALLTQIFNLAKKKYELEAAESRPILEELLFSILREGTTQKLATDAYENLIKNFIDLNEIRVSSPTEVGEALSELPSAGVRAQRIVGILQEWFELTYSFNMDELLKKGQKEGARKLSRLHDVNEFSVAWVVQRGFGGHAMPLDTPTLRVLHRVGAIDDPTDSLDNISGTLEHYIPKAKGPLFTDLISEVAADVCHEKPKCPQCPLRNDCLYALNKSAPATGTPAEKKPRKSR
jgi:endonuclease-3